MFTHLLVPLDGSRFGSRALRYAVEVARQFDADIMLLQIIKPATPIVASPMVASPSMADVAVQTALMEDKRNVSRAKRYLSGKAREIRSQNIKVNYQAIVGEPAQSIIEFNDNNNIDLVVMSSHGRNVVKRAIMGSVADKVIRESKKPVLVIRPQTGDR
jgi:nucleotide-binding universal stress UspA family protein